MNRIEIPNQLKFDYSIELLEENNDSHSQVYSIVISFREKKFYTFNMNSSTDKDGNSLFYLTDLLSGILSYQHRDLMLKKLNVPGYDEYINCPLTQKELIQSITYLFERSKNLIYYNQKYTKGRIAFDIVENLYNYINQKTEHSDNNSLPEVQDNQESILLEKHSSTEDDLTDTISNEVSCNYNDEGDSIDSFVKTRNSEFYGGVYFLYAEKS